ALLRETAHEAHFWRRRAEALADELELTPAAQYTAAALGARAVAAAIATATCAAGGAPRQAPRSSDSAHGSEESCETAEDEQLPQLAAEACVQAAEVPQVMAQGTTVEVPTALQVEQPAEASQAPLAETQAARPEFPHIGREVPPVRIVEVPQAQERIVEVLFALQAEQPVAVPQEPPAWLVEFAEQAVEAPMVHIVECVIELRPEVRRQLHPGAWQRAGVALAALLGLLLRLAEAAE
ncbi:unnamed protein product, partial [Prorocentrum cordatum]